MYVSTTASLFLADLRQQSKVLYLPAASTAQGRSISIKDYYGNASLSSLRISTTGLDKIETYSNYINLTQDFQCIEFTGIGNTNWSITNNYNGSLVTSQKGSTIFGIANMSLWLDGNDTSSITTSLGSSDVLVWNDKSSNHYSFTPVNSNLRSQYSTNCIVLTASTSHFLSQQQIPANTQCDMFVVLNESSVNGPLTGIVQNADLMFLETDHRYHTQFFADGNTTFTTLSYSPTTATFFILQGTLYANAESSGAIHQYNSATSAFSLAVTAGAVTRGATIYNGNAYLAANANFYRMSPANVLTSLAPPGCNFVSAVTFANQIFTVACNSTTYPVYTYIPTTSTWSNVGSTNLNNGRLIVYNGMLYYFSSNSGNFVQYYTGNPCNITPFVVPFGLNYASTTSPMVFSNSIVYGQTTASRFIEYRLDTGCLYMASNSNIVSQVSWNSVPINYRGKLWMIPTRTDANTVYVSYFSGKNQGTSGASEFVQVSNQTFTYLNSGIVYDGSLFIGTSNAAIYRYGNGATVDVNISSISSSTSVNVYNRPRIAMIRKNATTTSLWVNGIQMSNKTVNFTYSNNMPQQMYIGGTAGTINSYNSDAGRDHMEGALYEVINFTSTLQASDRQKIEGYLAWKYNISDVLPTGHPYLSGAPTS
jgi:hypothetical protein